jgi:hypothetical protein
MFDINVNQLEKMINSEDYESFVLAKTLLINMESDFNRLIWLNLYSLTLTSKFNTDFWHNNNVKHYTNARY